MSFGQSLIISIKSEQFWICFACLRHASPLLKMSVPHNEPEQNLKEKCFLHVVNELSPFSHGSIHEPKKNSSSLFLNKPHYFWGRKIIVSKLNENLEDNAKGKFLKKTNLEGLQIISFHFF